MIEKVGVSIRALQLKCQIHKGKENRPADFLSRKFSENDRYDEIQNKIIPAVLGSDENKMKQTKEDLITKMKRDQNLG